MNGSPAEKAKTDPMPEVLEPEAPAETMFELLRGGAAITKVENETLAQIAVTRPRNQKRSLERALEELAMDPEFAEKQYYRIPYKDHGTGQTNWVEGLSIKAAMALGRCFGNMTASARIVDENDHAVIVEGVCIDLETGFRVSKPAAVSKFYRAKKTRKMVKWAEDRFPQVLGAGASKAVRNAILNVIPEPLQRRYWRRAMELAQEYATRGKGGKGKTLTLQEAIERVLAAFEPFGVKREHLEKHLGHPLENANKDEFGNLRGVLNAIEQGQTSAYEAFGVGEPEEGAEAVGAPVSGEDVGGLFGGKAS